MPRPIHALRAVIAETVRPRKYYVTVVNCRDPEGTGLGAGPLSAPLFYTITFLNPGGTYRRHFSYDEQGQLEAFIAFVVLDVLFALCGCCVYYSEKRVEAEGRLECEWRRRRPRAIGAPMGHCSATRGAYVC